MRKLITAIVLVSLLSVGCGNSKVINGKNCPTYGFINSDQKCKNVAHRVVVGNVVWCILFSYTVIIPALILGLDIMEPVGVEI